MATREELKKKHDAMVDGDKWEATKTFIYAFDKWQIAENKYGAFDRETQRLWDALKIAQRQFQKMRKR